jgi:hypothetical protein
MADIFKPKKTTARFAIKTAIAFSKQLSLEVAAAKQNATRHKPIQDGALNVRSSNGDDDLLKLLADSIKDIYWSENYLVKGLPKMAKAAFSKQLSKPV